jgi:hypothetical protein
MQGLPLAPGTEDNEEGIQGLAVLDARPMAPERVRLPRREQRLEARPSRVR